MAKLIRTMSYFCSKFTSTTRESRTAASHWTFDKSCSPSTFIMMRLQKFTSGAKTQVLQDSWTSTMRAKIACSKMPICGFKLWLTSVSLKIKTQSEIPTSSSHSSILARTTSSHHYWCWRSLGLGQRSNLMFCPPSWSSSSKTSKEWLSLTLKVKSTRRVKLTDLG